MEVLYAINIINDDFITSEGRGEHTQNT